MSRNESTEKLWQAFVGTIRIAMFLYFMPLVAMWQNLALFKQRHGWRFIAPFYPILGCGWLSWILWFDILSFVLGNNTSGLFWTLLIVVMWYPNLLDKHRLEGSWPTYIIRSRFMFFMEGPGVIKGWYFILRARLAQSRAEQIALFPDNYEEIMRKCDEADAAAIGLLKKAKNRKFLLEAQDGE